MTLCEPVPTDPLACYLFTYNGNIVGVDLIGAGIPLVVSTLLLSVFLLRRGGRISLSRALYRSFFIIFLGLVVAGEFTIWDSLHGTLRLPGSILAPTLFAAALLQFWGLDRIPYYEVLAKSYITGTLSLFLSDLFRTLGGVIDVSPQIIGGHGLSDAVFFGGPFFMLSYAMVVLGYFAISQAVDYRRARKELS